MGSLIVGKIRIRRRGSFDRVSPVGWCFVGLCAAMAGWCGFELVRALLPKLLLLLLYPFPL